MADVVIVIRDKPDGSVEYKANLDEESLLQMLRMEADGMEVMTPAQAYAAAAISAIRRRAALAQDTRPKSKLWSPQ
jgi:hypothetical protein